MKEPKLMFNDNGKTGIITLADIGVGGERGVIYSTDGICCALSATQYKDPTKVLVNGKRSSLYQTGD